MDVRRAIPPSAVVSIQSIGVVSSLGPDFQAKHIGPTIFNEKSHQFSVPNWGVDDFAIKVATDYLNSAGRYDASPLGSDFGERDFDEMLNAARSAGHDTLVVLTPTKHDNQRQYTKGYGLYRRGYPRDRADCVYSLFIVQAFDVASGKKHGWEWSFPVWSGVECYGTEGRGVYWDELADWQETLAGYSEEQRESLRRNVFASIADSVPRSLKKLGF